MFLKGFIVPPRSWQDLEAPFYDALERRAEAVAAQALGCSGCGACGQPLPGSGAVMPQQARLQAFLRNALQVRLWTSLSEPCHNSLMPLAECRRGKQDPPSRTGIV